MKRVFSVIFSVIFLSTIPSLCFAEKVDLLKELSTAETEQLEKGELLLKTREVDGSAWPEITIYTLIQGATSLESMGIFSALDYQKDYVPNVVVSKPIQHISPVEVVTEYEMHVPFPLANAHYKHGSVVHQYAEDYELTWYKISSSSTDEVNGSAYFSQYKNENKTLFRYRSYIKPKSIFGSLVKKIMLEDVKKTIAAIRTHIEKLKKENSPLLSKYSAFITRALKGESVYKNLMPEH